MESRLLPCPICGSTLEVHSPEDWSPTFNDPDSGGSPYRTYCKCGFEFSSRTYDYDEFVKLANRRAEQQSQPARALTVEELEAIDEPTPIYFVDLWGGAKSHWQLVEWAVLWACPLVRKLHCVSIDGRDDYIDLEHYGKTWLAYDCQPESEG